MITPSFGLTATERVLPKLALDFTTASLDARVTFTRSGGTATRTNASGYIESVAADTPRFDYDPLTLACKGLLIEEARTNQFFYSNDFTNVAWTKVSCTVNAGATVSPDGTSNASKLSDASQVNIYQQISSITSGVTVAYSFYVKKSGSASTVEIYAFRSGFVSRASLNFDTGVVTDIVGSGATAVPVGNGWYRFSTTFTSTATASHTIGIYNTTEVFAYGSQFEAGAFATSYIPTTLLPLTRNADVAVMTGTNFSDWFNASEGTFVLSASRYVGTNGGMTHFSVSNGTNSNRMWVYSFGSDGLEYFTGYVSGVPQWDMARSAVVNGNSFKMSASYKTNNARICLNSGSIASDASCTIPIANVLRFGQEGDGSNNQKMQHIEKLFYWDHSLTNNELIAFSK